MASLVLLRNPLAPHTREIHPLADGTPVIDWLQEHHPAGFGMPCRFYVNGEEKPLDDLDYAVSADDVAVIALMPGDPGTITLSSILIQLAVSAVLTAAAVAVNYFFQPKERAGSKDKPISIYDISSNQNSARIGEPIPVVYGTVLTTPDYVSQPYTYYTWDQSNYDELYTGIQYLNLLLCVGQGNVDVSTVFVADTKASAISDVVSWQAFKPADHEKTMGVISSAMGAGFHENVITSPEVGNQEFIDETSAAGFFATCKPGQKGRYFSIDIVFPGGMTDPNADGEVKGRIAEFRVKYRAIDDNGAVVGTTYSVDLKASTEKDDIVTGPNVGTTITTTSESASNKTRIGAPLRRTYKFDAGSSARWSVRLERISGAPNLRGGTNRFIWAALKLYADYPTGEVYGDVTLLAVKIRASEGVGSEAAIRVRVEATRRLEPPNGGTEVATTSGAYAFADVYCNTVYGAARPRSELDVSALNSLHTLWGSTYKFNYVFTERTTIWEALRTICTPFGAEPVPVGPVMSAVQDGVKSVRSALFTDANIVAGSMAVNYSWDEEGAADGVEIEYLDPKDFRQSYTRYPTTSLRPDQYTLPGVTNADHAAQYARLTWQRRMGQRKRITFDTELEGLLLQLGDRIGVAHNVPKWGDSGLIIGVSGLVLTADHDLNWSGGAKQILLRKPDGSVTDPITVTQGAAPNLIVLPSASPTTINVDNDYEYTSFAFGSSTTLVRDFIVTSTTPTGENTVTVDAVNYAPSIFTGAMTYMD